jgi:PKD repeat protein
MNPITKIAKRYVNVPMRKALLLLIGVIIIISVAGCTSSTSSSPTPTVSVAPTGAATAAPTRAATSATPTSVSDWEKMTTAKLTSQGYTFTSPFAAQTISSLGTSVDSATAVKGKTTEKILAEQTPQSDAPSRFNDMVAYVKGQGYSGESASRASASFAAWAGGNARGSQATVSRSLFTNGQAMVVAFIDS